MNHQRRVEHQPFSMTRPLPDDYYRYKLGEREIWPTVTVMLRDPRAHLLLVLPSKAAKKDAFMFPQGPIRRHETPQDALLRVLKEECGYEEDEIEIDGVKAVGVSNIPTSAGNADKLHHVVYASLRRHIEPDPKLFKEDTDDKDIKSNKSYVFIAGPNFLWEKIIGCRDKKRRMIIGAVTQAVKAGFLVSDRWRPERLENLTQFAHVSEPS